MCVKPPVWYEMCKGCATVRRRALALAPSSPAITIFQPREMRVRGEKVRVLLTGLVLRLQLVE
jgi:hypothetical protein